MRKHRSRTQRRTAHTDSRQRPARGRHKQWHRTARARTGRRPSSSDSSSRGSNRRQPDRDLRPAGTPQRDEHRAHVRVVEAGAAQPVLGQEGIEGGVGSRKISLLRSPTRDAARSPAVAAGTPAPTPAQLGPPRAARRRIRTRAAGFAPYRATPRSRTPAHRGAGSIPSQPTKLFQPLPDACPSPEQA
jgi:hypothetical protein